MTEEFGGRWTTEKLDILEKYLEAYLKVFKFKGRGYYNLLYIDAFAGTGEIQINDVHGERFIEGSVKRALRVPVEQDTRPFDPTDARAEQDTRPFDRYIFMEIASDKVKKLEGVRKEHPQKDIRIIPENANGALMKLCVEENWRKTRAVLFLDPFSTELAWETIDRVCRTEAIDVWFLFPVNAIQRMLPIDRMPPPAWESKLNAIFGGGDWRGLYAGKKTLFDETAFARERGTERIIGLYTEKLKGIFGVRLLRETKPLISPKNRKTLFQFMFAAGNPRGIKPAHNIARHLIRSI